MIFCYKKNRANDEMIFFFFLETTKDKGEQKKFQQKLEF